MWFYLFYVQISTNCKDTTIIVDKKILRQLQLYILHCNYNYSLSSTQAVDYEGRSMITQLLRIYGATLSLKCCKIKRSVDDK